jgi:hypothetical protein
VNTAGRDVEGLATVHDAEVATSAALESTTSDRNGVEVGLDFRHSRWLTKGRADRLSLYNGFVGARIGGATGVRIRGGHMWLADLGTMGALAGGLVEVERKRESGSTLRVGGFAGLEPNFFDMGYASGVRKYGGFAAVESGYLRRHVAGLTIVRQESMTERAVLSLTNFVPAGRAVYVYQAAEFEVRGPAQGAVSPGLSYFLTNVRVTAAPRVELLGSYNRGRSLDARRLTGDLLNNRSLTAHDLEGLRYEGGSGRITVEPVRGIYAYVSYSRDRTNRDDAPTGRVTLGGHAGNILGSGFDASFSNGRTERPSGPYHSRFVSIGRTIGRSAYVSADYSTSLSVLRFQRADGLVIETRPWMRRLSASGSVTMSRHLSLLCTVDRTVDDALREIRVLAGLSYRIR